MQKTFKNMWVVVDKNEEPFPLTMKKSQEDSEFEAQCLCDKPWHLLEDMGYTCVKVNVTFDIVKP